MSQESARRIDEKLGLSERATACVATCRMSNRPAWRRNAAQGRALSEPPLGPGPDLGDLAQLLAHPGQVIAVDADQEQALPWRAIVADAALVHIGAQSVADGDVVGEISAVGAS